MLDPELVRALLADLGRAVQTAVTTALHDQGRALGTVAAEFEEDVIYAGDVIAEEVVLAWLAAHWPADDRVDLVMEGYRADPVAGATGTLVIDPIDGTRGWMADKRSAWFLAGYAPTVDDPHLADVTVASMTELPTTKHRRADTWSAVRGKGPAGVHGVGVDLRSGDTEVLRAQPLTGTALESRWASVPMALPEGIEPLAEFSAALFRELGEPVVFHDQYLCSGGQLHDLFTGRDALLVDPRAEVPGVLAPHPYDVTAALIATEAGCVVTDLDGGPLDAPLVTTANVTWVGVANEAMAARVLPAVRAALDSTLRRR